MTGDRSTGRVGGRVAAITAVTGMVIAVLVGGTMAAGAAVSSSAADDRAPAGAQAPVAAAVAVQDQAGPVTPQLVATGLRVPGGEFVLRVHGLSSSGLPQTRFGVMLGLRDGAGAVEDLIAINEVQGSDVAPGFHSVQAPTTVNGLDAPEFGYYAGPAAKITGKAPSGATIEAARADITVLGSQIVLFWFDPTLAGPCTVADSMDPSYDPNACDITGLAAVDASGAALPAGPDAAPGHG